MSARYFLTRVSSKYRAPLRHETWNSRFSDVTLMDEEINNSFKIFSELTQALGQVHLMPGMMKMIKAFAQHIAHRAS